MIGCSLSRSISRSSAIARKISIPRQFFVPFVVGFTIGFVLHLNHYMLLINEQQNYLIIKYGTNDTWNNLELDNRMKNSTKVTDDKVLCWVLSESAISNHVIRKTWGRRCDYLLFMVTKQEHYAVDEVKLSNGKLLFLNPTHWQRTREAWCYVYEHYFDKADWFLATQPDSYVVVENLRQYLKIQEYKSQSPIYLGHAFRDDAFNYISTKPAYLFSKATLQRFGNSFSRSIFPFTGWISFQSDSYTLGVYMNKINVTAVDARDIGSRLLFVPHVLDDLILKKTNFRDSSLEDLKRVGNGADCCSDVAIALHLPKISSLIVYEYALYQLKAYGYNLSGDPQY